MRKQKQQRKIPRDLYFQRVVNWITSNNPAAVSEQLFELRILSEPVVLDSDDAYEAVARLYNEALRATDRDHRERLINSFRIALAVPFNPQAGNWTLDHAEQILAVLQQPEQNRVSP